MPILHQYEPHAKHNVLEKATLRDRIIAQLIDGIILGVTAGLLYYILSGGKLQSVWVSPLVPQFLLEVNLPFQPHWWDYLWGGHYRSVTLIYGKIIHIGYPSPLLWGIYGLYYTGFTARYGQTPGKMAKRLVVLGEDKKRIPCGVSFFRWAAYTLSVLPFGWGIWRAAFQKTELTWHDMLTHTAVYRFDGKK